MAKIKRPLPLYLISEEEGVPNKRTSKSTKILEKRRVSRPVTLQKMIFVFFASRQNWNSLLAVHLVYGLSEHFEWARFSDFLEKKQHIHKHCSSSFRKNVFLEIKFRGPRASMFQKIKTCFSSFYSFASKEAQ